MDSAKGLINKKTLSREPWMRVCLSYANKQTQESVKRKPKARSVVNVVSRVMAWIITVIGVMVLPLINGVLERVMSYYKFPLT